MGGECARCRNVRLLDDALGRPARDPALDTLKAALLEMHPIALNKWLTRSPLRDVFRASVATPAPRAASLLATAPRGLALTYLRQLLLAHGVIPETDVWLEMYDRAIAEMLDPLSAASRRTITAYSGWSVRPRLLRSARKRPVGGGQYQQARQQVAGAIRLLAWLDERGTALRDLDQTAVDEFTSANRHEGWLRNFLRWVASAHGLRFYLPSPPKQLHFPAISDERRIEIAAEILRDPRLPLGVKCSSLLVIAIGTNITTAVSIRRDAVRFLGPGAAWIRINGLETQLPPWLARLFWAQADTTYGPWLFPGRIPGAHLGAEAQRPHIARYGVTLRELQTATRFHLASSVNPVILANTLGLTPATMIAYRHLSGGSWSDAPIVFGSQPRG